MGYDVGNDCSVNDNVSINDDDIDSATSIVNSMSIKTRQCYTYMSDNNINNNNIMTKKNS